MRRHTRIGLTGLVVALVMAGGAIALAAGSLATVQVKGGYGARFASVCGKINKHYKTFHRGGRVQAQGSVIPAPATQFKVRLEIKRCIKGVFVKVGDRFLTGQAHTGAFNGFFGARALAPVSTKPGVIYYDRVRAIVGRTRSEYDYFAITN